MLPLFVLIFLVPRILGQGCGISTDEIRRRGLNDPSSLATDDTRLVGGVETEPHTWPWVAQLMFDGDHRCGGVLIDNQFVLTAAHCFARTGRNPSNYTVHLGGHLSGSGTEHRVSNISVHYLYNIPVPNAFDIALLKINPPIKETSNTTSSICLPLLPAQEHKICIVAGWGVLAERAKESSEILREIHIPVVPWVECAIKEQFRGRLHFPSMICAGMQDSLDSCQGDSGGPLMCHFNGKWEVQGLVSWGYGCGRPGLPGVYASVYSALPWIQSQMWILQHF